LLSAPLPAVAQTTYTWVAAGAGSTPLLFSDPANWQGGTAPLVGGGAADTLRFAPPAFSLVASNDRGDPGLGSPAPFSINRIEFASSNTGTQVANATGNTLQLAGANPVVTQSGPGNATISGSLTLAPTAGSTTLSGTGVGALTISGVISGSGGITVSGAPPAAGTQLITLSGANTFTGGVTLTGSNLAVGSNTALGAAGGTLTVTGPGTLMASTSLTALAANVVLNADLTVTSTGSSVTLDPAAVISGPGNLAVRTENLVTVQSAATYAGTTTVDINPVPSVLPSRATLVFSGTAGAAVNSPAFNVRAGGVLSLTSDVAGSTVNDDRLQDDAAINLRSGELRLTGANTAVVNTETVGAIAGAGYSTVTANPGSGNADTKLTAAALSRVERGTFLFRGNNLGTPAAFASGYIFFATAPGGMIGGGGAAGTPTVSILPYAVGANTSLDAESLVTYDTGPDNTFGTGDDRGIRPLAGGTEYTSTFGPVNNVRLAASVGNAGVVQANALVLAGAQLTGTGTLSVTSGALLSTGGGTDRIDNAVALGSVEGSVFVAGLPSTLTITGPLTGTNGLTKSGFGRLVLSGDNTGLTGPLTLNSGFLSFATPQNVPGSGAIVVNGGLPSTLLNSVTGLEYTGSGAAAVGRDIHVNNRLLRGQRDSRHGGPRTRGHDQRDGRAVQGRPGPAHPDRGQHLLRPGPRGRRDAGGRCRRQPGHRRDDDPRRRDVAPDRLLRHGPLDATPQPGELHAARVHSR
jgi:autotransporter-associated beta strand protein